MTARTPTGGVPTESGRDLAVRLADDGPHALDVADAVWTERDVVLYALSVGAGQTDPSTELALTTECVPEQPLQVLPTFAASLLYPAIEAALSTIDWTHVLFAEQALTLHAPLPSNGRATVRAAVVEVNDQGRGALVRVGADLVEETSGSSLASSRAAMFVRGAGDFDGHRAKPRMWCRPDRAPDAALRFDVRRDQSLLYRLNGDLNPLHADPGFARLAGLDAPILHGLCTYGITARLLINEFADGNPARVRAVAGRFTSPVLPGERLQVSVWEDEGDLAYVTCGHDGRVVIDRGRFELT